MRIEKSVNCMDCPLKCDIYLTAREMGMEELLKPVYVYYKKFETICRQGSKILNSTILIQGNAKMFVSGHCSRSIILNILIPSNYVGLISVYGLPEYPYSVSALEACHTCQIDNEALEQIYLRNEPFMKLLNHAFGHSVSNIMDKLITLNQKHIRGRVAESLLYLSRIYDSNSFKLSITRRELGELSAISEENTVRVLTELRNENVISTEGRNVVLKDTEALLRISMNC
jgi:CRP/FNR family transcriptional regulator